MTAYRKRPVVIEAVQWDGSWDSMEAIKENYPAMDVCASTLHPPSKTVRGWSIRTLEGSHVVSPGDWIIKGVKGEFYPCKDEIFRLTYEPAACPRPPTPQPEAAVPRTEAQITEAITNWFAEDWAIAKARGLLADLGIIEQKEGGL